jgi:peptidyl-prolyl cis-trans isomerase B (cyclophilin B)
MRRLTPLLVLACVVASCGGKGGGSQTTTNAQAQTRTSGCTTVEAPAAARRSETKPTQPIDTTKTYDVVVKTNCGSFTIRLDPKGAPHTVASFVALAREKFFDGTIFHRIVPGFVIQGGDPTQTGDGGPGYTTVDKPPANARYTHGVVAMAKTSVQPAGTSGSQFFVVTAQDAALPPDYAIVGKVTKGLDVVDRIGKLGDQNEQPTRVVEIEHATVTVS